MNTTPTVVAVANAAGSAGKTVTAVTLATLLAMRDRRVLLIDLDPQANATNYVGLLVDDAPLTAVDVLRQRATLAEAALPAPAAADHKAVAGSLRIVAGHGDLDVVEAELSALRVGSQHRLRAVLKDLVDVDVVIIDCPGWIKTLTLNALVAADHVITTTYPTLKEARGIADLDGVIGQIAELYNPGLALVGIVPCRTRPGSAGNLYAETMADLAALYGALLAPSVREAVAAPTSYKHQTPLPLWEPRHGITTDYVAVLEWLDAKGAL